MNKNIVIAIFFGFFALVGRTQDDKPKDQGLDSLQTNLKDKGIVIEDSALKKKKVLNPLAPAKAAFYSALFPGLGQIYNKRYWKVPIVYAALGSGIAIYSFNNTQYNTFRDAFKRRQAGFFDDEFFAGGVNGEPRISNVALEDAQERFQRDRDLALLVTIILYALNVVDANVDAHLKQFNVDDSLSLNVDFTPYIDLNPITNDPNYGMALVIKF